MLDAWVPLVLYAALLAAVAAGMIGLSVLLPRALGARKPTPVKAEPYECGVPPVMEGARLPVSVRFYLLAIVFILFDVETALLLPWAIEYRHLGFGAFVEVLVFIGVLVVAYVYLWKRRALEWE